MLVLRVVIEKHRGKAPKSQKDRRQANLMVGLKMDKLLVVNRLLQLGMMISACYQSMKIPKMAWSVV